MLTGYSILGVIILAFFLKIFKRLLTRKLCLGDNLRKPETWDTEYKAFRIPDYEDLYKCADKDAVNKFIDTIIYRMLIKILPKYFTCFGNSHIHGKVLLGVEDNPSIITGLFCFGHMSESKIKQMVHKILREHTRCKTVDPFTGLYKINQGKLEELILCVSVKIVELGVDDSYMNKLHAERSYAHAMHEQKTKENKAMTDKYDEEYDEWMTKNKQLDAGLATFLNYETLYDELLDFVENNIPPEDTTTVPLYKNKDNLMRMIHENGCKDPRSPTKYFSQFKEQKRNKLKESKPTNPKVVQATKQLLKVYEMEPQHIFASLYQSEKTQKDNTSDPINAIMIILMFDNSNTNNILFEFLSNDLWRAQRRIMKANEPSSEDL